ncbi:hypothetical protein, partial [Serratia sp. CY43514]|uniref:hypothetical protein n=1 Tax=Serratia sp. CY43514 TaxID=3383620 RepID=UPI0040265A38
VYQYSREYSWRRYLAASASPAFRNPVSEKPTGDSQSDKSDRNWLLRWFPGKR